MEGQLSDKVKRAIKILRMYRGDDPIEVSYSGGKDSDVILTLTKMAGIPYRAIYKNTTIDPPGTVAHCKDNGVEIVMPKERFFDIVAQKCVCGKHVEVSGDIYSPYFTDTDDAVIHECDMNDVVATCYHCGYKYRIKTDDNDNLKAFLR